MQSTFQAGVDAIYNALVAAGATPDSKDPADIAVGITNGISSKSFVATLFKSDNKEGAYMYPAVQDYNGDLTSVSGDGITLIARKNMDISVYILVVDVFIEGHSTWYYHNGTAVGVPLEDRGNRAYYCKIDLYLAQNDTLSFKTYLHDIVAEMVSIVTR